VLPEFRRQRKVNAPGPAYAIMTKANDPVEFAGEGYELKLDVTIPATLTAVEDVVARIVALLHEMEFGEEKEYGVTLAVHEALVNAVTHGADSDPGKNVRCCVASNTAKSIVIMVRDPGPGFDPQVVPDCKEAESIYSGHGRGVYLMAKLMDKIEFHERGTEVRLKKS
jgi:anti-sigma regulatory factor (Ser/Thr protein kinase)